MQFLPVFSYDHNLSIQIRQYFLTFCDSDPIFAVIFLSSLLKIDGESVVFDIMTVINCLSKHDARPVSCCMSSSAVHSWYQQTRIRQHRCQA